MNSEDAEDRICRQYFVCGVVQGVFFRDSAQKLAQRLNLSGYAKNLPDGTVEIVACGSAGNIAKMSAWLGEGPPMATVDAIEERIVPNRQLSGFTIA